MDENKSWGDEMLDESPSKSSKRKFFEKRSSWILTGIMIAILIILVGAGLGIPTGIRDRLKLADTQAAPKIQSQLDSAKLDYQEGRFQIALERLDWILEEMNAYISEEQLSEIGDLYSKTLLELSTYGTPTPQPTPTATIHVYTPTPDLRGEEELFNLAQQQIMDELWDEAIQTLESLRQKNLDFRTIQVDGMLYVALRNRGVDKILVEGNLEPGLYDLALAERFAPLDSQAEGFRTWTRLYLTGASYWEVDWAQAVYYFEQVYPALPNLRDGTNMTAKERFRIAALEYAKQLIGLEDYCLAQEYFDKALQIGGDPQIQPTVEWVGDQCLQQNSAPTPAPEEATPTPTPTPTLEGDLPEPTVESTPEETVEP
ncbi:MAG: hypothetical protein ACK2TV_12840 [Anaerolineales bacterium]